MSETGRAAKAKRVMGLVLKDDRHYRLAETYAACLDKRSPASIVNAIGHHHRLVTAWAELPEAVRTGQPRRDRVHLVLGEVWTVPYRVT